MKHLFYLKYKEGAFIKLIKIKPSIILVFAILCFQKAIGQDWIPLKGPIGVNILHSIITRQEGVIFVLMSSGEVFKSTDKGKNWTDISKGLLPPIAFFNLYSKFAESIDGKIYLFDNNHFYIFNSNNQSWTVQEDTIDLIDYTVGPDGTIYAGNLEAFYISEDEGKTFVKKAEWIAEDVEFECQGNGNNFVRLDHRRNVFSFEDDGSQLKSLNLGIHISDHLLYDTISNTLLNFYSSSVYLSKDKGNKWIEIKIPGLSSREYRILRMSNGNLLVLGNKAFISEDGGLSWKEDPGYAHNFSAIEYASISNDSTLLWGAEYDSRTDFAFILPPNTSRTQLFIPINKTEIINVFCFGEDEIFCDPDGGHNFQYSGNNGISWKIINSQPWYSLSDRLMDAEGNYYLFGADSIYILDVAKDQFIIRPYPYIWSDYSGGFVSKTNVVFLFDKKSIYISHDKAMSWISHPVKRIYNPYLMNCSSNDILYYTENDTVFYSNDYGISWNNFIEPYARGSLFLSGNNIFYWINSAGGEFLLYSSSDFGKTRVLQDSVYLGFPFHIKDDDTRFYYKRNTDSIVVRHSGSNQLEYISFSGLDFKSTDNPQFFVGPNGYIYCKRSTKVLYRTTEKITETKELTDEILYLQIIPNPSKEITHLQLPDKFEGQSKSWFVYDVSGKVIMQFHNSDQTIKIMANQLQSGFYFVQVVTDKNLRAVGKILINK